MNNLYNLVLLPQLANRAKTNKRLSTLQAEGNAGLPIILDYIGIEEQLIDTFSKTENLSIMKNIRGDFFYQTFIDKKN